MRSASSKGPQFEDPRVAETAGPRRNFSVDRVPESERSPAGPLSFETEPSNRATKRPTHEQRCPPHAEGRLTKQQPKGPCLACHREGHAAKNCPTWKGRCYRCHKEGHTSESCSLPDKRGKATRITANDNRELARALANITRQLQDIKAQLKPNWAWRTLRPFRERTASHNRKPLEEPNPLEAQQPKPPEVQKQRTDLQGCDPPLHMHIGENMMTVSRLPPVPAWCVSAKTWHTLTPAECRQSEADYENSNNKKYDDGMILHTRDNTWLLKNFPKNPHTDRFAGAVASLYAMHFHDNMWLPGWGHIQQHPQAEQHNAAHPSDDDADEPSPTLVPLPQQYDDGNNDDGYDDGYDSDLWRPDCGPTVLHDHCPTGTDPFLLAVARASTAEENTRTAEPKPPTGQQQSSAKHNGHTKQKEQHAKQRRRKK